VEAKAEEVQRIMAQLDRAQQQQDVVREPWAVYLGVYVVVYIIQGATSRLYESLLCMSWRTA